MSNTQSMVSGCFCTLASLVEQQSKTSSLQKSCSSEPSGFLFVDPAHIVVIVEKQICETETETSSPVVSAVLDQEEWGWDVLS